jgi:hypothetical protein
MYKGFAWLITVGSGFHYWVHWHFFTITVNYNSSQSMTLSSTVTNHERITPAHTLNSLTNDVCLTNLSEGFRTDLNISNSEFESEFYLTTDAQSASLSLNKVPIWGLRPDYYYCQTLAGLLMWGALSDDRTGLSYTISAGLASAVILGSESHGTRDHSLLPQIRDFPFRRLLRLARLRWRY